MRYACSRYSLLLVLGPYSLFIHSYLYSGLLPLVKGNISAGNGNLKNLRYTKSIGHVILALLSLANQNRKLSIRKLTGRFNQLRENNVSHETVRKELLRRGYQHKVVRNIPMLTDRHKQHRVSWARSNKQTDWERVVFSDEMSI